MPFNPDQFLQTQSQQPAPSAGYSPDQMIQDHVSKVNDTMASVGMDPRLALPESPLSPMERGAFGWIKDPKKQQEYLSSKFGKGNVSVQKMEGDQAGFIVKTPDGKWRQVDPHGLSDVPADLLKLDLGSAAGRFKNFNMQNTLGGAAQFMGEHGFDSGGAAAGGAAGAAVGSALGPIGTLVGAVGGGALGGMGGALAERGVRGSLKSLSDATGTEIPGSGNTEDLKQQMMSSMLFGASQELAGPFLKAGAKGAGALFGKVLKTLGDTPEAKQAQAALIKGLSGMKDGLARAWADAPEGVAKYIPTAIKDKVENSDALLGQMKEKVGSFFSQAQGAMRGLGKQYDAIDKQAAGKVFNALEDAEGTSPIKGVIERLQEQKYVDGAGEIVKNGTNDITRDVSGTNGIALRKMLDNYNALQAKGGKASYQELRIMERNVENYLFGPNQVTDGTLRNIMGQMRSAINTVQSKGLNEVAPELANRLADLNSKYGPAKELLGTLGQKSEGQRLDAFLKQVIRDDGSYNAEMMNSVGNLLGLNNPTKDILHMEVARNSAPWFTGTSSTKIAGVPIPASPGLARQAVQYGIQPYQQMVSGVSKAAGAAGDAAASYLPTLHGVFKNLPDATRKIMVQNPAAIGAIGDILSGAAVSEGQDKNQLLKGIGGSGDFQKSQFGQ